jgi:threonine/homoserine/homoserine lactone efflux protein
MGWVNLMGKKIESKKPKGIVALIFMMGFFAFFFLFIGALMIITGSQGAEEWAMWAFWNGVLNFFTGVVFVFTIWGFGKRSILAYVVAISLYFVIILRYIFTGVSNVATFYEPASLGLVGICAAILFYLSRRNVREYFKPSKLLKMKEEARKKRKF